MKVNAQSTQFQQHAHVAWRATVDAARAAVDGTPAQFQIASGHLDRAMDEAKLAIEFRSSLQSLSDTHRAIDILNEAQALLDLAPTAGISRNDVTRSVLLIAEGGNILKDVKHAG